MNTHVIGEGIFDGGAKMGQWEAMCKKCRDEVLTRFKTAMEFTRPENYEKTFTVISHKIVDELYEKNKSLVVVDCH